MINIASETITGNKMSKEARRNMSRAQKKRWKKMSEETKKIMSEKISKKLIGNKNMILESSGHPYNYRDLSGQKFGHLIVTSLNTTRGKEGGCKMWNVKCYCGKELITMERGLINGNKTSCGCLPGGSAINLRGQRYNKLLVVSYAGRDKYGGCLWDCLCDCGVKLVVTSISLRRGNTKSCGCLRRKISTENGKLRLSAKKGNSNSNWKGYKMIPFTIWNGIITGAMIRGIEVSINIEDLAELYEKQKGKCAISGIPIDFNTIKNKETGRSRHCTASLDRIDSSLGYIEGNIQWTHTKINWLKNKHSQNDFIEMCKLVADNN